MNNLKDPVPLNVFDRRKTTHPPVHFEYLSIPMRYNISDAIERWIEFNLKSRYYIGKSNNLDSDNKIINSIKVGFEDPKEASYFMLACPHLKY